MRMTIELDLESPESEDRHALDLFTTARRNYQVLCEVDEHLRSTLKYNDEISEDARAHLQAVRDMLPGDLLDSPDTF